MAADVVAVVVAVATAEDGRTPRWCNVDEALDTVAAVVATRRPLFGFVTRLLLLLSGAGKRTEGSGLNPIAV